MPGADDAPIRSLVTELKDVTTPEQFGQKLKELKEVNGLTFETIERRGGIPSSTASSTLGRRTLPTERFLRSYVRACGVDAAGVNAWVQTRERLQRQGKPLTPSTPAAPLEEQAPSALAAQPEEQAQLPSAPAEEPAPPLPSPPGPASPATRRSWLPENGVRRTIVISLLIGVTAAATITTTVMLGRDNQECRNALDPAVVGVCFWKGQDFSGAIRARRDPAGIDKCADIDPVKSVVNLTKVTRIFYSGLGCEERNVIGEVPPGGSLDAFKYGYKASSWR